jgi:hypothetical protein
MEQQQIGVNTYE